MNLITRMRVERMAARDARHQYEANLDHVGPTFLGPRPRPPGEIESGTLLEEEGTDVRLEALADEIEALERQRFELRSRGVYAVGMLAAFIGEAGAGFFVLESLGFEPRERLLLGTFLAASTALVAAGISWAERATRSAAGRWALRIASALVFCSIVVSLAWLRATSGSDDLSVVDIATTALILVAATATPGIIVHICATGFARTNSLVQRSGRAAKKRKSLESARERARELQVRHERGAAQWDADFQQLRSVYLSRHRQVTAEIAAKRPAREETRRERDDRRDTGTRSK